MTLDASGRLAVGTSSFPNQNSGSLAGSGIFNGILRISGASNRYFTSGNGLELAVGSIYSYNRDTSTYNDLGINDAMTIKGGGNVGIGTTSPRGLLQIYGAEVAAYKTYTGQGNTGGGDTIINAYRLDSASAYLRVTDIVALGDDTNNRGSTIRLMTTNTSGVTSAALTLASTGAATFSSSITQLGEQLLVSNAGSPNIQLRKSGVTDWGSMTYTGSLLQLGTFAGGQTVNITTGGNVGIGTTSPTGKLMIEATGNHLFLRASTATAGKYWALDVTSANQLYIVNNAGTQYLTITDGGNVGIGTTSPANRLDVLGTAASPNLTGTNAYARFYQSGGYANITIGGFASGSFAGWVQSSDGVGTSLPLVLQPSGGNVGIGTTSPGQLLTIQNTSSNPYLSIIGGASATMGILLGTTGNTVDGQILYSNSTQHMAFVTNSAERMRITSGGSVGIGTSSPGAYILALDYNASAAAVMSFKNSSASGYSGAHLLNNSGSLMGHFGYANASTGAALQDVVYFGSIASKAVVFTAADTERMRITSGGNVEINTGSIKTGEPDTGYGRAAVKIGPRNTGQAYSSGGHIPVSIDGTVYFINLYTLIP
jgi:hypothetical protein